MPHVHVGKGATLGSVIPTRGAIIPAALGVDIGCGMAAVRTTLRAEDLPDNLARLRSDIERSVPVGNGRGGEHRQLPDSIHSRIVRSGLVERLDAIKQRHRRVRTDKLACQIGTLGGGNHFIEICLDETGAVWVMLHSGSRGTGNLIGTYFIEQAREQLARRVLGFHLPDKDLAFFMQGEPLFDDYVQAVSWAQDYARENREAMMARVLAEMRLRLPKFQLEKLAVNCHHNYVQTETHGGEELLVTRKGAVSARAGELGIIPGSMGTRSYIVRGKGNAESFHSCSHGAGRVMSRSAARQQITLAQHREATAHVECRKDAAVIDESPAAYKSIDAVMAAQRDLVEVVHTLRQVVCIKG
jgi:tRNA-splicing ligase RtcB